MTRARVSRRPSAARRATASRPRAMIAPARVAAYEILAARLDRARRSADGDRARARQPARRSRSRARRRDRHRRPALARRARSPDRHVRQAAARRARSGGRRDPAAQRLSAAAPDARPGVGGRGRCRESDAAGGQAERRGLRQRRAADDLAQPRARCRCRRGPPIRPIATPRSTTCSITLSHPRWLAARWLDRFGFDAAEAWLQFNNAAGAADAARQPPAHDAATSWSARLADEDVEVARRDASRPTRSIVDEGHPLRGAGLRRRAGSSCRTRRRSSSRCSPATGPARACSTPARRPAARPPRWRRAMDGAGLLVACDVRDRRIDAAAADGRRDAAPPTCASCRPICCSRCPSRDRSTACSSTRPAPASARCAAIPTSAGGGAKRDLAALAAAQLHDAAARRRRGRARRPAGLRHLLERAGGERRRRRRVSRGDAGVRAARRARGAHRVCRRRVDRRRGHLRTAAASPRPRSVLRRGVRAARAQTAVRTDARGACVIAAEPCSTICRSWPSEPASGARASSLLLVGALRRDLRRCSPRRRCASRCARARSQVPDLTNRTANEATALASRPRPRRCRSTTRAGPIRRFPPAACSRRSRPPGSTPAPAQRQGLAERRPARVDGAGARRRDRAHRAAAARAGRPDAGRRRRNPLARLPAGRRRRAGRRRPKTAGAQRGAARQPRRARRQLRDARSDRRQRRSRRRDPARPRLPRRRRRLDAVSRRRRRHRDAPEPAGRLPDRARASRSRSR